MKRVIAVLVFLGLLTVLLVACGGSSGGNSSNSSSSPAAASVTTVHMSDQNFVQSSITVSKGSSVTLVDDVATLHIIANGSWVNGSPQTEQESGSPTVNNVQVSGNGSQTIGPFNTTGTYHFYCTVHPGMNLTVTVQ
jgi:plastocyanin